MLRTACVSIGILALGLALVAGQGAGASSEPAARNPFRPLVGAPTPRPSTLVPPSSAPTPRPPSPLRPSPLIPSPLAAPATPAGPLAGPGAVRSAPPASRPARYVYVGLVYDAGTPGRPPAGLLAALRVDGRLRLVKRGDRVGDAVVATLTADRLVLVSPRGSTVLYRRKP